MNTKSVSLLIDPHPSCHIVYPYTDEALLTRALNIYAVHGLTRGEAVILITTQSLREAVERSLSTDGVNVAQAEADRRLVFVDAEQLLSRFMIDGTPDADLFKAIVDTMILEARGGAASRSLRKIRVFGEMVSLLWGQNPTAALRLEELWNDVVEAHSIPLLCTYSLKNRTESQLPPAFVAAHSHALS